MQSGQMPHQEGESDILKPRPFEIKSRQDTSLHLLCNARDKTVACGNTRGDTDRQLKIVLTFMHDALSLQKPKNTRNQQSTLVQGTLDAASVPFMRMLYIALVWFGHGIGQQRSQPRIRHTVACKSWERSSTGLTKAFRPNRVEDMGLFIL